MRTSYADWLRARGYEEGSIATQLSRVGRVEDAYGDLDELFASEGLDDLIDALRYSAEDERQNKPNTTLIPFNGVKRTNLASHRTAVSLYQTFCAQSGTTDPAATKRDRGQASKLETAAPPADATTLLDFRFDGLSALEAVIAQSRYQTVSQAIASLTLFSHPSTVEQTGAKGVFPMIRDQKRVGERTVIGTRRLMFDDNKSPTDAFLWANNISRRGRDTQFNHVYTASDDPDAFTSLANICMTPAFLAKLTDTSPLVRQLLEYRSYDLYRWRPEGSPLPEKPVVYDSLRWATPLPAAPDVAACLRTAMARKPKDRTVVAARELGWLFGQASTAQR